MAWASLPLDQDPWRSIHETKSRLSEHDELLLLNCYPDPALLLDAEGRSLYLNPAALGLRQRLGDELKLVPGQLQARFQLSGAEVIFQLHWSRLQWQGSPTWMLFARREAAEPVPPPRPPAAVPERARAAMLELELKLARQLLVEGEIPRTWVTEMERHLESEPDYAAQRQLELVESNLKLAALSAYYQKRLRRIEAAQRVLEEELSRLRSELAQPVAPQARPVSRETERLAFEDPLTLTPNANILLPYLEQLSAAVARQEGSVCAMLLEIDNLLGLKRILGTDASDKAVREVARRIRALLGPADVVGRLSGGRFLALINVPVGGRAGQAAVTQRAHSLVQRILPAVAEPVDVGVGTVEARMAVGLAVLEGSLGASEVLEQAQTALEQAKKSGKPHGRFGPSLQRQQALESSLLQHWKRALEEQQFSLLYQPIVDLGKGRMMGVEALLRWHHPTQGVLEPGAFLELADSAGLLLEVEEWVVAQACTEIAALSGALVLMINVTNRQVVQADLARRLMKAWERTRLRVENLVFEIPETMLEADPERTEKLARQLTRGKASVAIDDFGSGLSSLRHLKPMGTVFVKLAPSLIAGLPRQDEEYRLCRGLLTAAASLHLHPIAKNVETLAQAQSLREMGCRFAQGQFFAPPLTDSELRGLRKKNWKF